MVRGATVRSRWVARSVARSANRRSYRSDPPRAARALERLRAGPRGSDVALDLCGEIQLPGGLAAAHLPDALEAVAVVEAAHGREPLGRRGGAARGLRVGGGFQQSLQTTFWSISFSLPPRAGSGKLMICLRRSDSWRARPAGCRTSHRIYHAMNSRHGAFCQDLREPYHFFARYCPFAFECAGRLSFSHPNLLFLI